MEKEKKEFVIESELFFENDVTVKDLIQLLSQFPEHTIVSLMEDHDKYYPENKEVYYLSGIHYGEHNYSHNWPPDLSKIKTLSIF